MDSPDASDQPIVGSRVFVAVRSSEIRGAIEPRVFASFDSAILWCYCTHSLHRPHWQAFLTKFDPNGPLRMNQGGKARRARYVGWQQEMNEPSEASACCLARLGNTLRNPTDFHCLCIAQSSR